MLNSTVKGVIGPNRNPTLRSQHRVQVMFLWVRIDFVVFPCVVLAGHTCGPSKNPRMGHGSSLPFWGWVTAKFSSPEGRAGLDGWKQNIIYEFMNGKPSPLGMIWCHRDAASHYWWDNTRWLWNIKMFEALAICLVHSTFPTKEVHSVQSLQQIWSI